MERAIAAVLGIFASRPNSKNPPQKGLAQIAPVCYTIPIMCLTRHTGQSISPNCALGGVCGPRTFGLQTEGLTVQPAAGCAPRSNSVAPGQRQAVHAVSAMQCAGTYAFNPAVITPPPPPRVDKLTFTVFSRSAPVLPCRNRRVQAQPYSQPQRILEICANLRFNANSKACCKTQRGVATDST
jgi:hypothetical protein